MKKILILQWGILLSGFFGISLLLLMNSCGNPSRGIKTERKVSYVDSVWIKGTGQINVLQIDPIYFARTSDGNIHQSRSKIHVGDSFVYIYIKER